MQIENIFPTGRLGDNGRAFMVRSGRYDEKVADLVGSAWVLTALGATLRDLVAVTDRTVRAEVALADAAATLTAAQIVSNSIFTITPTLGRTLTTDTATAIIAALPQYQAGTWSEITIVNLAAQTVTLVGGVGVALSGVATINAISGTWLARIDSATALTLYRK